MSEIPKIVRARLQANGGGSHPDANLLSAFAEKSLAKKERSQVLEHLSACADCRDVVMLAAPKLETAGVEVRRSTPPSWLSWPVLRWSGAIACVVVVGTVISLHYQDLKKSPAQSTLQISDQPAYSNARLGMTAPTASGPELAAKPVAPEADARKELPAENKLKQAETAELDHVVTANLPKSPSTRDDRAKKSAAAPLAMAQGSLAKSGSGVRGGGLQAVEVTGASPLIADEAIPGKAKDAGEEPAISTNDGKLSVTDAARTAPRISPMLRSLNVMPRWTLASDGTLQRSLDSGRNWEAISIASGSTFRALAANGLDIWVGGTAGALYHSGDAGRNWTQVQPSANGITLTADIIGVEFTDPQHGRLTTAQSEIWVTADGGQSWQK